MISANSQANATRLSHVSMTMACQFLASTAELSVNEIASMMTVTRYARNTPVVPTARRVLSASAARMPTGNRWSVIAIGRAAFGCVDGPVGVVASVENIEVESVGSAGSVEAESCDTRRDARRSRTQPAMSRIGAPHIASSAQSRQTAIAPTITPIDFTSAGGVFSGAATV